MVNDKQDLNFVVTKIEMLNEEIEQKNGVIVLSAIATGVAALTAVFNIVSGYFNKEILNYFGAGLNTVLAIIDIIGATDAVDQKDDLKREIETLEATLELEEVENHDSQLKR